MATSELGSIIQKAHEELDEQPLSAYMYGPAGPLAHTAWQLTLFPRANLQSSVLFLSIFVRSACGRMSPGKAGTVVVCTVRAAWHVSEVSSTWCKH